MRILVSACLLGIACRYDGSAVTNEAVLRLADRHTVIPFCPEVHGGLATPREPAEISGGRVVTRSGADVTRNYQKGAEETLRLMKLLRCDCAVLQDRSPSCGSGVVHDGTFCGALVEGDGLTAHALKAEGFQVIPASRAEELANSL